MDITTDLKQGRSATTASSRLVPRGRSSYRPKGRETLKAIPGHRHAKTTSTIGTAGSVMALAGTSAAAIALMLGLGQ
ncbi:hypothetical protein EDF46_3084 [Frondihabitans sp. PhB188]|uniref:hypothetical protein n=1 Tax=Frondihabitans sp. PhB188 TaxID=2485200 RepID=UPI000F4A5025|nr:hypothetical protein [Frondihabitans sp. PhB188]ROQ36542.1 hypothetical protein EDF46_3084 [Frondihabitans sp. PhB188]